jgi:heat shock protein HslJ
MVSYRKLLYGWITLVLMTGAACAVPLTLVDIRQDDLQGTQWQLESFGPRGSEIAVVYGTQVTLAFMDGDQVGGTDGCNTFEAEYEVSGGRLLFKNIRSSLVVCGDQGFMHQENEYLKALGKTGRYEIQDDRLIIWYDNGQYSLNFSRSLPPGLVGAKFGKG